MADNIEFLLVGLVLAGIGILWLRPRYKLKKACTAQTVGTVTGTHTQKKRRRISSKEYMSFKYSVDGVEYEQKTEISSFRALFMFIDIVRSKNKDENVTVFYDPSNPQRCYTSKDTVNGTAWGFLVVGAILIIAAFL